MNDYHQLAGTFKIGGEIEINRLGYGGMQLTGQGVWGDAPDRENAKKVLRAALDAGVNFIDTADSYGPHTNETLIADALHPYPGDLLIATKGGFDRTGPNQWRVNGNPEHIRETIDGSLQRLRKDVIDLWQLHRIDPRFPVEETLGPVVDAVKAGKIRFVACPKWMWNK
nr:aldo/keto reductase [Dyadobacter fermentans]